MAQSLDDRKTFLLEGARLYDAMTRLTTSEVIRRYLAFRIIVNAMSFEDVISKRSHVRFRQIRNVLLAHKQDDDFFAGYNAADEITHASISTLLNFMAAETPSPDASYLIPELSGGVAHKKFSYLLPLVFAKYNEDFLAGFRIINNHLCYTGSNVHEVSAGSLPGVFYRYHSSMALFQLAQYIHSNASQDADLYWTARHAKLDMLLHAQNLADTIFKGTHNSHSIDGLLEVMTSEPIGDASALVAAKADSTFLAQYSAIRHVRNKLIGHMDKNMPMPDLLSALDAVRVADVCELVNHLDKATFRAAQTHIAIRLRYVTGNQPIVNPQIVDIPGLKLKPYF